MDNGEWMMGESGVKTRGVRRMRERMRCGISRVLVCLAVVLVMAGQAGAAVKKNALVIGNGAYKNITALDNPVNDAGDMKAALEKIGFEVIVKIDAGRSEIREAVRTFGDRIKRGGVGLFYYAGHGIQVDGVNYIIPVGVDIKRTYDVEDQALRMNYVLGAMEEANNQLNIVILDACRDNPFRSISSFRGDSAGLARMDAPTGTIVAYATAPGRKAEDGRGRNGTYTGSLLKHLTLPGLSIQDMLNNTGLDVMKQTRNTQVPWISSTPVPRFFLAGGNPEDQDLQQAGLQQVQQQPVPTDLSLARETPEAARPASTPRTGEAWKEPVTGMEFVWVPGGCYMMGSPLTEKISQIDFKAKTFWYKAFAVVSSILPYGCVSSSTSSTTSKSYSIPSKSYYDIHGYQEDETPAHEVCLDGFWIGKYEVTQGQWQKIMNANPAYFKSGDNFPVESISWNNAKSYIEKLSRQSGHKFAFPTEAQWEYAARSGGKNETFAGDNDVISVAWYRENSGGKTHRVGTKVSNGLGIYDMSGNVWEWCEDVYDKNAYSKHARNNPVVTSGGSARVLRGGSWSYFPRNVRAAYRNASTPGHRNDGLGFRLSLPQPGNP